MTLRMLVSVRTASGIENTVDLYSCRSSRNLIIVSRCTWYFESSCSTGFSVGISASVASFIGREVPKQL